MVTRYLKKIIVISVVILFALPFFLTYWEHDKLENYQYRFVMVAPIAWPYMADGVRAGDEAFHTHTKLVSPNSLDVEQLVEGIENAIRTEADGIITAAISESEELKKVIQKARNHGIPVVLVDNDFPESARNCYVGTDNVAAGILAGENMQQATNGEAQIGIVVSQMSSPNQQERIRGFQQVINRYPGMKVVEVLEGYTDYQKLAELVPKMLKENTEINALYLTEARSGTVVGKMIEELLPDRPAPVVVAFDALDSTLEYLNKGIYDAVINQSMYDEGYTAVEVLCRILNGKNVEDVIYTKAVSITQEMGMKYEAGSGEEYTWYDQ